MITREEAEKLAVQALNVNEDGTSASVEFIILPDKTIEKEYGWIFLLSTREYEETKDVRYRPAFGIGPAIVLKDGTVGNLGTGRPLEAQIAELDTWMKNNPLSSSE